MNKFRETVKRRRVLCGVSTLLVFCIAAIDLSGMMEGILGDRYVGEVAEFQIGILTGLGLVAVVWCFKYTKALQDEERLRMLYNNEHDERKKMIRSKAGMPMLLICSSAMILAGIIAGYFNRTVFLVLIWAAIFQMTAGVVVKLYYLKNI